MKKKDKNLMRNFFLAIIFTLLLSSVFSCRKTEDINLSGVELLSPAQNTTLHLPDTVQISFRITGEPAPDHVAISIVNRDYIPLFGTEYISNPETGVVLTKTMTLHTLQHTDDDPYYILIAPYAQGESRNNYFPVKLENKPLAYKGFYLFTKSRSNQTLITYYNGELEQSFFARADGAYVNSDISDYYQKLYLITEIPAKLQTFSLWEQQQDWETEPAFPYPVYTDLQVDNDWIFAAMGNGQIIGYSGHTGQPKLVSERLADSLPQKIAVTHEYIVGFYKSRINGRKSLVSFYKVSGVKKHRYPVDFEVTDLFKQESGDKVVVIGNRNDEGLITIFDPYRNMLEGTFQPGVGRIETACEAGEGGYLFATNSKLYAYQPGQGYENMLMDLNDVPKSLVYENQSGTVFLLYSDSLVMYAYPQMSVKAKVEPESEILGLEIFYRYE